MRPTARCRVGPLLLKHVTTRQVERDGWEIPTRGECSDTGKSARRQGFRTARDDAMRAGSSQGLRRLCHVTDSVLRILISKANYPICPAHPTHLPLPSTRRALLHGVRMELLTGTATLPTTTNLPIVRQAGWTCWSLEPPPTPPPPFPVFSVVARGYSAMH